MHQIARGIFYEDSYLGVTLGGLVFPHGTIMIDAPLRAEDSRSWRSALSNQRGGANRLLVNLDAHLDRTLGDRALDSTVLAHQKTVQVFRNRPTIFKGQTMESGATWETYNDAIGMRWAVPDIAFSQNMLLFWGGPEVVLEYHPGPAPGAMWVIVPEEKVVFVGDAVTVNQPPFLANADLPVWVETLDLLISEYSDYLIISGRGGPAANEVIRAQYHFLQEVLDNLDRLAIGNALPEATEEFVPEMIRKLKIPPELRERYRQRLRYGLYQYYTRRYRSMNSIEQTEMEDEER